MRVRGGRPRRVLHLGGYQEIQPLLSTEIRIPRFQQPHTAIQDILARRIELAEVDARPSDLFSAGAPERFAELYDVGRNLRKVLAAADRSVQSAFSDGVAPVNEELVTSVLAELA